MSLDSWFKVPSLWWAGSRDRVSSPNQLLQWKSHSSISPGNWWILGGQNWTAYLPGGMCVTRRGTEQGPFLMGKWQSCPPQVLTLWKEGRKPPPGGLPTEEETSESHPKDQSQTPNCERFFIYAKILAWSHFSWVARARCLDSVKPSGGLSGILTWPGCWEGSHSHYREPDLSRAWKERPVRVTMLTAPGVVPNQKYPSLISIALSTGY